MVLIVLTITAKAQIPNNGFENWTSQGNYMDPQEWYTANPYSTSSFYPVTRSTDHYPSSVGDYSIRIENNVSLLPNYEAFGLASTRDLFNSMKPLFPISGHPNSLTGYYKFIPQNNDTMWINVLLYLEGDEVAWGRLSGTTAVSSWTSFNIPLSSYTAADSATIDLASYFANEYNVPYGNSVLYVDNLSFDNLITSVNEQSLDDNVFSIFPNPARNIVTLNISSSNYAEFVVNIYNVAGSLISSESIQHKQQNIDVRDLNNGIYLVEIKSKKETEIQKLIIQK